LKVSAVTAGRFEMFEGLAEEYWYRRCGETWRWRGGVAG
jgi:hypothetical protein